MNQLAKLQNTFQSAILENDESLPLQWISATGRVDAGVQLSAYSFAYQARLIEVLCNDFTSVLMAIGDDEFNALSKEYIKKHPSHYFSLRDFGCDFANFLLSQYPQDEMYWIYELATFEWQLGQAFDAADVSLFKEQDLNKIAPEQWPNLKFKLQPSVQSVTFKWNTVEMWQVLTSDEPSEVTPHAEEETTWLIWREQLITRFRSMQENENHAFTVLQTGGSFSDICESLMDVISEEEIPMYVASLLKTWISQNLLQDIQ